MGYCLSILQSEEGEDSMSLDTNTTWPYFSVSLFIMRENQVVLRIISPYPSPFSSPMKRFYGLWFLDNIPHFPKWPAHEVLCPPKPVDISCQLSITLGEGLLMGTEEIFPFPKCQQDAALLGVFWDKAWFRWWVNNNIFHMLQFSSSFQKA